MARAGTGGPPAPTIISRLQPTALQVRNSVGLRALNLWTIPDSHPYTWLPRLRHVSAPPPAHTFQGRWQLRSISIGKYMLAETATLRYHQVPQFPGISVCSSLEQRWGGRINSYRCNTRGRAGQCVRLQQRQFLARTLV